MTLGINIYNKTSERILVSGLETYSEAGLGSGSGSGLGAGWETGSVSDKRTQENMNYERYE